VLEANVDIISVLLPFQSGVVFVASIALLMVLYKNELTVWWEGKGVIALPLAHSTILMCGYLLVALKAACQAASSVAAIYWPSQAGVLAFFSGCVTVNFGIGHGSCGLPLRVAPVLVIISGCVLSVPRLFLMVGAHQNISWESVRQQTRQNFSAGFVIIFMWILSLVSSLNFILYWF